MIRHHAFFWLKRPGNTEDRARLLEGLRGLGRIEVIKELAVGVPAATEARDVVDASFDVSEMMRFATVEDQRTYQDHPLHRAFVAECEEMWERVVVYDVYEW